MHFEGDQHYYETRLKQEHAHVVCLAAANRRVFWGSAQRLRAQVEAHFGFQILVARTEIGGYCPHCQVQRAREMELAAAPPVPPAVSKQRRPRGG